MHVAIDTGALGAGDGIGRYLDTLLPSLLASRGTVTRWSCYGRGDVPWLRAGRGNTVCRNDRLPKRVGRVIALASSLPWWTWRDRPDVYWGPAHRLPLALPASVAAVVTIHDVCWKEAPSTMRYATRRLDAALMPRALARAQRIVACSQATAASLARHWPQHAGKTVVVAPGAASLAVPGGERSLHALGIRHPYVLFVGTLEPRKNLHRLLHAFSRLRAQESARIQLVIAGSAGWGEGVQGTLDELALADRVVVTGRVDDATLSALYRGALFLALPSLYEGFGLPLVEAMSNGTPVLTSSVASMPEVAGDAGLLVDPCDIDSIGDGMRRMLLDSALRERLAAAAPAQAARFSLQRATDGLLAAFAAAVTAPR